MSTHKVTQKPGRPVAPGGVNLEKACGTPCTRCRDLVGTRSSIGDGLWHSVLVEQQAATKVCDALHLTEACGTLGIGEACGTHGMAGGTQTTNWNAASNWRKACGSSEMNRNLICCNVEVDGGLMGSSTESETVRIKLRR